MKIVVLSDSTASIPEDIRTKYNIHIVPLSVVFKDAAYKEEVDITTEAFYEKVRESEELPTTSQPSIGSFVDKFEELSQDYDAVITIHISSKLSGTYQAARTAGEMVESIEVYSFDSLLSAMAQGLFAIKAAEMAEKEIEPQAILQSLEEMRTKIRAYFMVDDLSHLQRGGRLSSAQAIVGSLLKIKPLLHILDGFIVPYEKVRTSKKAKNRIMNMLKDDVRKGNVERVVFIHGNCKPEALKLRDDFQEEYPEIETLISYFGPVVGSHLGEGSIGVSWQLT